MKKFIYIIFVLAIVRSDKSFAQSKMIINTQEVVDTIGQVYLIHKDKLGDIYKIEYRKFKLGEIVEFDNQGPTRLIAEDFPSIYSPSFHEEDLNPSNIGKWSKNAIKSVNRNETTPSNNFSKKNELKGYVLTSDSLSRVKATISIFSESGQLLTILNSDANGKYSLKLATGRYWCEIKSDNCLPYFDSIFVSKENVTQRDFLLTKVKIGSQIVLKDIFFAFGKSDLLPTSTPQLDALVNFLKENITIEIELSGHTDNKGSAERNQILSEQRAKAVLDYLVKSGITKDQLKSVGFGAKQPIALNSMPDGTDNPKGRQENRRTEFRVLRILAKQ